MRLCYQSDVLSKTECRRLQKTGEGGITGGHTDSITLFGCSGMPLRYVSDYNFVANHACVLRVASRAKLNSLERDSGKLIKHGYTCRHYPISTLRYANSVRIQLEFRC